MNFDKPPNDPELSVLTVQFSNLSPCSKTMYIIYRRKYCISSLGKVGFVIV